MRILWICLIFGSAHYSYAQSMAFSEGASQAGQANTGVAQTGLWAGGCNPASVSGVEGLNIGLDCARPYLLQDVLCNGISIAMPVLAGAALGCSIVNQGTTDFHEQVIGFSAARSFDKKVRAGVRFDYRRLALGADYGRSHTVLVDAGVQTPIGKSLSLGMCLSNCTRSRLSRSSEERYPVQLSTGFSYRFSAKVRLSLALQKVLNNKASIRGGIEYHPMNSFFLRAGFDTSQQMLCFGMGWVKGAIQVDLASGLHPLLGPTPQVSITYNKLKKNNAKNPAD